MNTQTSYFKKALVVLMAVMMVFTMMPGMAWADVTEAGSNESSASSIAASGNCGAASNENGAASVTWKLSTDGTLTISGKGAMEDYISASKRPWHENKEQIQKVCIEDGVTSVAKTPSMAVLICKMLHWEIALFLLAALRLEIVLH